MKILTFLPVAYSSGLQADLSLKYGKPLGSQQKAHGLNRKISLNRGPGSVSYGQMPKF